MEHAQDISEFPPLERTRSFDEEPKQPTNLPNVIENALQKLDTATPKATTKATRRGLTKDDVKYLFSGAPHFMLEKGRHNHWYPHVLFPWDTSLPIQDLWDREQLRHESFTLSTLHAHLPIPSKCDNKDDSRSSNRQGWQYEEGVKRSTYDLGIFEVPNMLSINGKEPGAIGFRHFLELATADAVRYKRAVPTKGTGDALDPHLLSSMPLTEAFDTLSHLRDPYSLCNHESVVLDRHKLLCEGPAAWKRIGVRDVPVRDIVERLEHLSNFRLEAIKQLPTDESGHKKIITILDKESPETLHKNLYTKLLFPPPRGWSHHQHEELKGQIEVLTRVLAVKGAWVDMSLPEWRLRVGQILWEKPPHADGDCMDCVKDENTKSEENKKEKSPLSLNTGIERKWLLIQLLLAGELLMRLDAIVQLAVLQHSKTISVTAQDMRELDNLRHGKVNWDILFFQRASDNLTFKFTPPKTPPVAGLPEQSQQKIETPAQNETKPRGLRSRFGSISQHFPLRRSNSTRAGQENASHEHAACESIWETVVVLPRRPERQLRGLAVFAEKIGWPGHETLEARIRSSLLQHNGETTQTLTSESVSPAYSVPVKSQPASRILPKKEAYCRSPSHRYLVLHKSDSTADNTLTRDTGGWLSRSWLAGLVMPGESIHQLLMATALENDPTSLHSLGSVANLYGGLSYGDENTWWSTKCIVGRVLAALPGSKVCMGWVRVNTMPETVKDNEFVNLKNTWISVEGVQEPLQKNTRIRQGITMASESNPLGKGRVASDTFTIPVDEEYTEKSSQFDVKFDKLILSRQATPVECGSEAIKSIFIADRASVSFQVTTPDSSAITFQLRYNVAFISSYTCQPPRGSVAHHTPQQDDSSETHEHDEQLHHTHLPGHPLHKSYKYKYVPLKDLRSDTVPPIIVFSPSKECSPLSSDTHLNASHNEKLTHDHAHKQNDKEAVDETFEPVWILDARSSTRDKEVFARAWCAAVGVNALIGRVGRTCLACCVREARAIGVGIVIRV